MLTMMNGDGTPSYYTTKSSALSTMDASSRQTNFTSTPNLLTSHT